MTAKKMKKMASAKKNINIMKINMASVMKIIVILINNLMCNGEANEEENEESEAKK